MCRWVLVTLQRLKCWDRELVCLPLLSPVRFFRVKQASDYFKACLKSSLGVARAQRQIPLQIGAANTGGPLMYGWKSGGHSLVNTTRCLSRSAMTAKVASRMSRFQPAWLQTYTGIWTRRSRWTSSHPAETRTSASLPICRPSTLSTPWFKVKAEAGFGMMNGRVIGRPQVERGPSCSKINQMGGREGRNVKRHWWNKALQAVLCVRMHMPWSV